MTDDILGYGHENEELRQGGGPDHWQRGNSGTEKPGVRRIIFENTGISKNEDILVMERMAVRTVSNNHEIRGKFLGASSRV